MIHSVKALFTYAEPQPIEDAAEEAQVIVAAKAGDEEAQTRLLVAYGPALRSAVTRFTSRLPVEERSGKVEDAQMEALAAFMEVLHQHDPEKNPRLAGRLASRLVAALANAAQMDAVMTIPERTLSRFYGILRAAEGDLEAAAELAPSKGMSIHVFNLVRAVVHDALALPDGEDGDHFLAQPLHSNLSSEYDEAEDHILIDMAFQAVDDEEARIVELAYGFIAPEPVPDAEVGQVLGLTRPTVQRKRGKAIEKMRFAIGVTAEAPAIEPEKPRPFRLSMAQRHMIFRRDDHTCQICYKKVDVSLPTHHSYAAEIDHINPQRNFGPGEEALRDDPALLRLAHKCCNTARNRKIDGRFFTDEEVRDLCLVPDFRFL